MDTQPPENSSALRQVIQQLTTMQAEMTEIKQILVSVTELDWLLKKYLPEVQNVDTIIHNLYPVKNQGGMTYNKPIQQLKNQREYLLECQTCGFIWTSRKIPKRCSGPKRCKNWIRMSGTSEVTAMNTASTE